MKYNSGVLQCWGFSEQMPKNRPNIHKSCQWQEKQGNKTKLAYVCGSTVYVQKIRIVQELPSWVPFD